MPKHLQYLEVMVKQGEWEKDVIPQSALSCGAFQQGALVLEGGLYFSTMDSGTLPLFLCGTDCL